MRLRRDRRRRGSAAVEGTVTLGQRIKAARRSRGMTQGELASGACSISFVSMVEHGRVRPSLPMLRMLAERLSMPLSRFLDGESAPAPAVQLQRAEALLRQHRFSEALEAFEAARIQGDSIHRARCELGIGQALTGLRRFELAERHLRQAAEVASASGDPELIASAANAQGFFAFRARRFAAAQELFEDALTRLRAAGLQQTEVYGKLLANAGRAAIELGLPSQALEYFRQASDTLAAAADPYHLGLLYYNLGVAWEQQQSFERAHESLQKAAQLFTVHENARLLGMVKRSLGMLHLEHGTLAAARTELEGSLRLAAQSGDDEGTAQTLVEIARLCAREGDASAAQRAAADAESLALRIHDDAEVARAKAALAEALAASGRPGDAVARYEEAVAAFMALQMTGEAVRVSRDLGFLLLREGTPDQAAHWFARAFDLQRRRPEGGAPHDPAGRLTGERG